MSKSLTVVLIVAFALLAGAGYWLLQTRTTPHGVQAYDYAAAFESGDPASGAPLLKLAEIAGKTQDEVRAALGAPEPCETSLYSTRCRYQPGSTEVVYIDGKADWITVGQLGETPLTPAALKRVGLAETAPSESGDGELVWRKLAGFVEVRVEGLDDRAEFIRVKVRTP